MLNISECEFLMDGKPLVRMRFRLVDSCTKLEKRGFSKYMESKRLACNTERIRESGCGLRRLPVA